MSLFLWSKQDLGDTGSFPESDTAMLNQCRNTRSEAMITTPARAMELRNSKYDWGYKATMIKRPDYERVEKPHTRGKVLGGCGALNYYTWVRGSHGSYDDWEKFGGPEWTWNGCEPYFDKVDTRSFRNITGTGGLSVF